MSDIAEVIYRLSSGCVLASTTSNLLSSCAQVLATDMSLTTSCLTSTGAQRTVGGSPAILTLLMVSAAYNVLGKLSSCIIFTFKACKRDLREGDVTWGLVGLKS
jgi:hypothetical protein